MTLCSTRFGSLSKTSHCYSSVAAIKFPWCDSNHGLSARFRHIKMTHNDTSSVSSGFKTDVKGGIVNNQSGWLGSPIPMKAFPCKVSLKQTLLTSKAWILLTWAESQEENCFKQNALKIFLSQRFVICWMAKYDVQILDRGMKPRRLVRQLVRQNQGLQFGHQGDLCGSSSCDNRVNRIARSAYSKLPVEEAGDIWR